MRRMLCLVLLALLSLSIIAVAEDYDTFTIEELVAKRDELLVQLSHLNSALGIKRRDESLADKEGNLGKIKALFPDEALAMVIRDRLAKFSIEQTVTQEELDSIKTVRIYGDEHGDFHDLTGIGYLRNLEAFGLYNGMKYLGTEFPDEFYTLTKLQEISVRGSNLAKLSEDLGNLTHLADLNIGYTDVANLPESIGNLEKLRDLDIGNTKITSLPDSIWGLTLNSLDMSGLPIK